VVALSLLMVVGGSGSHVIVDAGGWSRHCRRRWGDGGDRVVVVDGGDHVIVDAGRWSLLSTQEGVVALSSLTVVGWWWPHR